MLGKFAVKCELENTHAVIPSLNPLPDRAGQGKKKTDMRISTGSEHRRLWLFMSRWSLVVFANTRT